MINVLRDEKCSLGSYLIDKEREHQLNVGFGFKNDDFYTDNQLALAALHYACPPDVGQDYWPKDWDRSWDKKTTDHRIEQLIKAGALIAAEIDRLLRKQYREFLRPQKEPNEKIDKETKLYTREASSQGT